MSDILDKLKVLDDFIRRHDVLECTAGNLQTGELTTILLNMNHVITFVPMDSEKFGRGLYTETVKGNYFLILAPQQTDK